MWEYKEWMDLVTAFALFKKSRSHFSDIALDVTPVWLNIIGINEETSLLIVSIVRLSIVIVFKAHDELRKSGQSYTNEENRQLFYLWLITIELTSFSEFLIKITLYMHYHKQMTLMTDNLYLFKVPIYFI